MRVRIRSDWCIALRIIALHEYYRLQAEFAHALLSEFLADTTIDDDEIADAIREGGKG